MNNTIITEKDKKILEVISEQDDFISPTNIGLKFGQTTERASGYCSRNLKRLLAAGKIIKERGKYKIKP